MNAEELETALFELACRKFGNNEIALFYTPARPPCKASWNLLVGNPTRCVSLGEVDGELSVTGTSLAGALVEMHDAITIWNRSFTK